MDNTLELLGVHFLYNHVMIKKIKKKRERLFKKKTNHKGMKKVLNNFIEKKDIILFKN